MNPRERIKEIEQHLKHGNFTPNYTRRWEDDQAWLIKRVETLQNALATANLFLRNASKHTPIVTKDMFLTLAIKNERILECNDTSV